MGNRKSLSPANIDVIVSGRLVNLSTPRLSIAARRSGDLDQHFPGARPVEVDFDDFQWALGFERDGGAGFYRNCFLLVISGSAVRPPHDR